MSFRCVAMETEVAERLDDAPEVREALTRRQAPAFIALRACLGYSGRERRLHERGLEGGIAMDLQQLFEKLVGRYFLYVHQWLFETTDGRITWLGGLPVLLLRTIGRKTRTERTAALVYLQDGKDLVVVASNGGSDRAPAWLRNIEKTPTVGVQIGRDRRQMRARIADPPERARLWPLVNAMNAGRYDVYQSRTEREIPLVILSEEAPG